jgi:hypothetical protein
MPFWHQPRPDQHPAKRLEVFADVPAAPIPAAALYGQRRVAPTTLRDAAVEDHVNSPAVVDVSEIAVSLWLVAGHDQEEPTHEPLPACALTGMAGA